MLINAQIMYLVSLSEVLEDGLVLGKDGVVCLQLILGQQVRAHRRRDVQQRVTHTQQHAFLSYHMLAIASLSWHIICWQMEAFLTYHMLAKESLPGILYVGKRKPSWHIICWQKEAFRDGI
jgi:hypothetical protein